MHGGRLGRAHTGITCGQSVDVVELNSRNRPTFLMRKKVVRKHERTKQCASVRALDILSILEYRLIIDWLTW